jgi:hypothetical protein
MDIEELACQRLGSIPRSARRSTVHDRPSGWRTTIPSTSSINARTGTLCARPDPLRARGSQADVRDWPSWLQHIGAQGCTDAQQMALAAMHHGEEITNERYLALTGINDSRAVTIQLGQLVADGFKRRTATAAGPVTSWHRRSSHRHSAQRRLAKVMDLMESKPPAGLSKASCCDGRAPRENNAWLSMVAGSP